MRANTHDMSQKSHINDSIHTQKEKKHHHIVTKNIDFVADK